jgi:hypothetical protein
MCRLAACQTRTSPGHDLPVAVVTTESRIGGVGLATDLTTRGESQTGKPHGENWQTGLRQALERMLSRQDEAMFRKCAVFPLAQYVRQRPPRQYDP